ncbi:MAG TPA: YegP family protein [Solirubrobacterales bacterium]|jgi:uncharacterized protein YegP (UPF0339 family)
MGASHYDVWQSTRDGKWYWHLVAGNGETVDRSSEGYETRQHAIEGVDAASAASQDASRPT